MKKIFELLFVLILFVCGCSDSSSPTEIQLNSSVNEKIITVFSNHKFVLDLDLNADGGYQWDCKISDPTIVVIDSTSYRTKESGEIKCGGLMVETFYFSGRKAGQSIVNLIENRAWEEDVLPINVVQFSVVVR